MISANPPMAARGVDTVRLLTEAEALALRAAGVDYAIQYLGSVTADGVAGIIGAGLGLYPVTFADQWDGPKTVAELEALGIPAGTTVFLDVEGVGPTITPAALIEKINAWADAVSHAGFISGLYVGAQAQLTSQELYELRIFRYWKGLSKVIDRNGALAEPACGWCLVQLYPTSTCAGVLVDFSFVQRDYKGRIAPWAFASPREAPTIPGRKSSSTMPAVKG